MPASPLSAATSKPRTHRGWPGRALVAMVVALSLWAGLAPTLLPANPALAQNAKTLAALAIFTGSYVALALGRIPGLRIDRAGIALAGAALMVAAGVLPLQAAYAAIDLDTITLLLGMMIVIASLRLSGMFDLATNWVAKHAHGPRLLLCAVVATSGIFSAFLVNDAICLVLTPLVLNLTRRLGRNPVPYLLAVAMASNVGSTATITGNPQNILIGSVSHIPYFSFAMALGPVAGAGLLVTAMLIMACHRTEFSSAAMLGPPSVRMRVNQVLVWRAVVATLLMVALFFLGQPPAKVAIIIAGLLLLTRRIKSARIYADIDWSLLLMFAGLFIIVAGAEATLLTPGRVSMVAHWHLGQPPVLTAVTAVLSNLVSNVPAVLVLKPFVAVLPSHTGAWLTVAMASTLAGNFTLLGSIANLIVAQKAASQGVTISFWAYFRVGAPLTLITLAIGMLWLAR